jgi:hypothetical protein
VARDLHCAKREDAMSRVATMPIQTIWDCRWSQPGYRLRGVAEKRQPESLWVCVRDGRRPVNERTCATCRYWEADEIRECP